ncbi:hypothetical protein PR202_gb28507 [Eleusine coracana subsp. coracana]|uniref:Uncharacterized protein n=1 Tax=Eleusine coracana subsp. coracana TaxID=191504 RepID=A0AAV5FX06_ELECO|nr:hypothetical protein PR202_gb28507 [Eleusine coracana subsp. coracana]
MSRAWLRNSVAIIWVPWRGVSHFSELDVGWVLQLADENDVPISRRLPHLTLSWISALFEITKSISRCFDGWYNDGGHSQQNSPAYSEFVLFVEAILLKMLPFGDAIVSLTSLQW